MRRSAVLLSLALALTASIASAENWPQWRGPRGDGISAEKNLLETWPAEGPKLLWSADVGGGYSSPIIADGMVYIFTNNKDKQETISCLDEKTGKPVWAVSYGPGRTDNFPGTRATPTLEGDKIYVYGAGGKLVCASAKSGEPVWKLDVLKAVNAKNIGWGMASSPLVVGDNVIVQSGNGGPVAVAVNKKTGEIAWQAGVKGTGSYAAPILITVDDAKQVIIFSSDGVHGLDPATGKPYWFIAFKTGPGVNAATPIYQDHHLFVSGEYGHGCLVIKLAGTTAERLWKEDSKTIQDKFPSPILDGSVMFANSSGTLKCVTWPDCEVKWEEKGFSLGSGGSFVRFGDKLITLGEGGKATLATATAAGVEKISHFDAFPKGKEIWSVPVISNAKLYLKGGDLLNCYDIAAAK